MSHQSSALSGGSGSSGAQSSQYQLSEPSQADNNEEMINLYNCNFEEFANHMSQQYGRESFTKGFQLISSNKNLIYTEEGEEQLINMLRPFFKSEDLIRGFLNFCTSYMIVQNYSQNIHA